MHSNFTVQYDAVDLPKGATAQARRLKVAWRGRPIAAFSQSAHRAYIYPVFTPAGVPVTGEMPIDHPHHNSITVGADHFNCHFRYAGDRVEDGTYNFYINDIFQGRAPGRTLAVSTDSREISERHLRVVQQVHWQGPVEWGALDRRVLARETRTIDIRTSETSNILDIRSRLEPTDWDIVIGPTRHAYFTVRMADGLRVVDGGKIMDADGHSTVQDINANSATWVDMSATGPHGHEVGVTVVAHPSPLPTGWYAHEWGTVAVNPFLHEEQSIRRGETLELAVTAIAHDGPCLP
jgi:hypothetical protein